MRRVKKIQLKLHLNKMQVFGAFFLISVLNGTKLITFAQKVPQEERYVDQITDEQRERIRKNRELAFERREAKRRRLEEIQTRQFDEFIISGKE